MKINVILFLLCFLVGSCHRNDREILLLKRSSPDTEIIDFIGNRYHGNFINIIKGDENAKAHYIGINDEGVVMHVLKYDNKYYDQEKASLDSDRSTELLVSDTSIKNDPTFFGYDINGYYSDTVVNTVILSPNPKTSLSPLSAEEKSLFKRIDSLAKRNNIKYKGFDTAKVLGWFKYVF
jgi:hypothetical protein